MGTPEFAVAGLDALIRDGQHVIAVVTSLDKPAGRGRKIKTSPIMHSHKISLYCNPRNSNLLFF